MKITFLGAAGTVTGSKALVEYENTKLLVDCGLFQGLKNLRLKNWKPFPFSTDKLSAVILTHAHLDHSGGIPKLIKEGFHGKVYCTPPTAALCKILLPDSGHLQEEDARFANKHRFSRHHPALPLYTERDANQALDFFETQPLHKSFQVGTIHVEFRDAGHILGASSVKLTAGKKSIVFSGDLGRDDDLLMTAPETPWEASHYVIESTYGDRLHPKADPILALEPIVKKAVETAGVILIPSFAVGRAQCMLYALFKLFEKFPDLTIPIYINSPMATSVSQLYQEYPNEHRLDKKQCETVFDLPHYVRSVSESIALNEKKGPIIIISASGMMTGGRILHHLKAYGQNKNNHIIIPGYQAAGTRGASLLNGEHVLKIHGDYLRISATVHHLDYFSAHADQKGLLNWLKPVLPTSELVMINHGEATSSEALRIKIEALGTAAKVAEENETVEI